MSRFVRGTDYFSILERGINGVYHHVSHEHLPTYLAEFDFRYNARSGLGISDPQRAGKLLEGIIGKRLTAQSAQAIPRACPAAIGHLHLHSCTPSKHRTKEKFATFVVRGLFVLNFEIFACKGPARTQ